jgi:SAGA-associated factor 73
VLEKVLVSDEKKPFKMSFKKKAMTSQSAQANWESKSTKPKGVIPTPSPDETEPSLPAPVVNGITNRIVSSFSATKTFSDSSNMIQCKHCKKPVFKSSASDHVQDCLRKKQEKLQKKKEAKEAKDAALRKERNGGISPEPSVDEAGNKKSLTSAKKTANIGDGLTGAKKTGKKRKADDEDRGPSKKKKKDDAKQPKASKPKGPVDVEKQCGVLLPNGSMCARSLTCKSHSMGAKRSVPGRSMPYDVLLAQYQKKSHARQHRKSNLLSDVIPTYTDLLLGAAMDANAPLVDDFDVQGNVDSDEERDAVMAAINRYYRTDSFSGARTMGSPLETWNSVPVRRRHNHIRLKADIKSALDGLEPGSKLFVSPGLFNNSATLFSAS